jgi:hypothetical protein
VGLLEEREELLEQVDEDWLLLFQEVQSWVFGEFKRMYEAGVLDEAPSEEPLNPQTLLLFKDLPLLSPVEPNHVPLDDIGCVPPSELGIRQQQMLLLSVSQHVPQVLLELLPHQPSPDHLLYLYYLLLPFVEVYLDEVPLSVASVERLDQDGRTVPLEYALQSVYVNLQIK